MNIVPQFRSSDMQESFKHAYTQYRLATPTVSWSVRPLVYCQRT